MATSARRQTLGPISTNTTNSRLSLGPGALVKDATKLNIGAKSRQSIGGRMSLAPRPATARQSLGGQRNSLGRTSASGKNGVSKFEKDPREIDKAFTQRCVRDLLIFLTNNGYNQPISAKQLLRPSQKDFMTIVTFLFQKLDPNFTISSEKKPEDEVITNFKNLGYPYPPSKSALQTAGAPHTWPAVLAALDWLIQLITIVDPSASADATAEKPELDLEAMNPQRLYFDKIAHAYALFMAAEDDVPYLEKELAASFVAESKAMALEIENLEMSIQRIEAETEAMLAAQPPLAMLQTHQTDLMAQCQTVQLELEVNQSDLADAEKASHEAQHEAQLQSTELGQVRVQHDQLQRQLAQQDMFAVDIARMSHEKSMLDDTVCTLTRQRDDLAKRMQDQQTNIQKRLTEIGQNTVVFNELASTLQMLPMTARNAKGLDLELRFQAPAPNAANVRDVVNFDLKHHVKPVLSALKEEFSDRIKQLVRELRETSKLAENAKESAEDKSEELNQLQTRHNKLESAYKDERDVMNKELARQVSEVEDFELELRKLQNAQTDAVGQMQIVLEQLQTEYDDTERSHRQQCDNAERQVAEAMEMLAQHKTYVTTRLEQLHRRTLRVKDSVQ